MPIMFNIARCQLLQGLNVICDSPLTGNISYERAQVAATAACASLAIVECVCSDKSLWEQHINERQTLQLPAHHQTNWNAYQLLLRQSQFQEHQYPIIHPRLVVDTVLPLQECLMSILLWSMCTRLSRAILRLHKIAPLGNGFQEVRAILGPELRKVLPAAKLGLVEQLIQQLLPGLMLLFSRSNHLCR